MVRNIKKSLETRQTEIPSAQVFCHVRAFPRDKMPQHGFSF